MTWSTPTGAREEAEAVPDHAPSGGGRRRDDHDVHLRQGPVRAMLAAIDGAQRPDPLRDLHLEGRRGRRAVQGALAAAADRGVEVYCIYDGFGNLVCSPAVQAVPAEHEGAAATRCYRRGWQLLRPAPLRRDHRKILVVDDKRPTSAATTWVRRTRPSGATPRSGSPARASRTCAARSRLLEPAPAAPLPLQRAALCWSRTASRLGAAHPAAPQRAEALDVPDPAHVHRGDQPAPAPTSG
jgi:hypothetical protein